MENQEVSFEDDYESLPSSDGHLNIEVELEKFRQQWYSEISSHLSSQQNSSAGQSASMNARGGVKRNDQNDNTSQAEPSKEDQALYLYTQGVHAEQSGRLSDAIQYYRRAMQLVPDIENRVGSEKQPYRESYGKSNECSSDPEDEEFDDNLTNLVEYLQKIKIADEDYSVCHQDTEQKVAHFSALPMEVVTYIFKWVISSDLDIHSLEQLSMVSRGFYLIARDEELWKLVCIKIWGKNCGRPIQFGSYRNMFLERPHLRFNGCYISKSTYFREGAKGLDNFYRPFHIVEYFRYVRFFPEGRVLMLTTPDNPYETLPYLRNRTSTLQGIMTGYYKMVGDTVTLRLKRKQTTTDNVPSLYRYRRARVAQNNNNDAEQNFEVELIVKGVGGRPHWQLVWSRYSMLTKQRVSQEETMINFELNSSSYPNLLFSRVRSLTAVAEKPLN